MAIRRVPDLRGEIQFREFAQSFFYANGCAKPGLIWRKRQVTMPRDGRSPSGRFLPTRAAIYEIGLLVNASLLLVGCASPSVNSGSVWKNLGNNRSEHSTVRSQNESFGGDKGSSASSHSAAADYGPLQSRFGNSQTDSAGRFESSVTAPGHSFLAPKVKLGRPIPLPGSPDLRDGGPIQRNLPDTSPDMGRSVETRQPNEPEAFGRTPWLSDQGTTWKPMANADVANADVANAEHSWTQLDESYSNTREETPIPQASLSSLPMSTAVESAAWDGSAINIGATQSINGATELLEGDPGPLTNADASGLMPESTPTQEPSMLERFRGLYTPRLEDNTDRLRKQIRRWPDPFRLLRDRDETVEGGSATLPFPSAEQETSSAALPSSADPSPSVSVSPAAPLDAVIADLQRELANWPGTPSGRPERLEEWRQRQTDLRLLYMVAGRSAESMQVIESLPEEEQEFWQSMMLSMNRYRSVGSHSDRAEQLSETLSHLRTASQKLQPLCKLQMRRIMLCDRIDGFGQISVFPTSHFNPGQRVLVYTDVQNFRSELTPDGTWRSEFAAVIEFMRQGDDEVVETIRIPQILDSCNTERTDYFHSFEITLPALAGQYRLRIRLKDQLSLQTTESQLSFNIRSQNSGL